MNFITILFHHLNRKHHVVIIIFVQPFIIFLILWLPSLLTLIHIQNLHHHNPQCCDDELKFKHNALIISQIFGDKKILKNLSVQPIAKTLAFNRYEENFFFQQVFKVEEDLSLFPQILCI